jgi:hypothetical protein
MGIESLSQRNMQNAGLAGTDRLARNAMFPQSQMDKTQYAVSSQMPTSAEIIRSDYDTPSNAYTGLANQTFAQGGIARLAYGGTPEEQRAIIADAYQKILGRAPSEGEDITQWSSQLGETGDTIELANRLAQTEEGTAYGKLNPNEVYKGAAQLSQVSSPFKDTETPYSNMKYVASHTTPTTEEGQGGVTTHRFQDQNGGVITVGADGQPINYEPGRGWYEEQLRKNPDAVRKSDYRNQTYLSTGPIDQTYNFNGVDVPITAQEFQLDPKTGNFITGKTGDYAPVLMKDRGYDWFDDWGGPAMVVAIPALAAAGAAAAGAYGAGAAGAGAAGGTTAGTVAGSAAVPLAEITGSTFAGPAFALPEAAAATIGVGGEAASKGLTLKDAYNAYKYGKMGLGTLNALSGTGGTATGSYGDQGINLGMGNTGFVANTYGNTGLGISGDYSPLRTDPIFLSKLSEFKADRPIEMASGGIANLGSYSDGGQLLKGPGDGMSDNIPAKIGRTQPARLADGEFVVPADVVSHLGNGSTDAGAKQLYKMMDRIRHARTGNKKQGKQINPSKFLPQG